MSTDRLGGRKTLEVGGFLEELEKEAVKKSVDIIALFASFGVELSKKGKSYTGRCPWHEDSTPSLSVDRDKGLYHCFGCGESGDVVSLVEKMRGVGFREALAYLAGGNGSKATRGRAADPPAAQVPAAAQEPAPAAAEKTTAEVSLDTVADFYHRRLQETPKACAYLEARGLRDKRLWSRFRVGYADGTLSAALSEAQRQALEGVGVFQPAGRETFAGYITVPLEEGERAVSLYGRAVEASRSPQHRYLQGPHRGLLNPKAYGVYRDELVLTESVLDALSLVELGIQNVSACYGTGGFTAAHRKALTEAAVRSVVVAFDADEAGRQGAGALQAKLQEMGIGVKTLCPPQGKDWNEYLVGGGTAGAFKELLAQSPRQGSAVGERLTARREGGRLTVGSADLTYRLSGFRDPYAGTLRVTVRAERGEERHVDHVDLYSARSRSSFAASLCSLWALEARRVESDLMRILDLLEEERERSLREEAGGPEARELTEEERALGLELLQDPKLFSRIEADMDLLGYVGEGINKQLLYLAASSRLLEDPLSVLVVSESAAGKSALIETVRRMMPAESVVAMSSLSDQALHYLGEEGLLHKFLVMGEALHAPVVEQQIREMLSAHELCRLVTVKDPKSGEMESRMVRKRVIVAAALSSTDYTLNPENVSRFFVVNADESEEQTARIHGAQRRKYSVERLQEREREVPRVLARHQAAQRLLTPRRIVNPFAEALSFPTRQMRSRRDHERFLDLIAAVAHLRQYQKPLHTSAGEGGIEYIGCDETDYRIAYSIMKAVLPSTLGGFPRGAVSLYEAVRSVARAKGREEGLRAEEVTVSQRQVREAGGFGQRWVKRYMHLLVDYEYLQVVGGRGRGSRWAYRLVKDEPLREVDLSPIRAPEEVAALVRGESGPSGP
jgi:DNA primase catalytic core